MMNVITKEQLQNLQPSQQISGILLIKDYNVALTKNGKEYIQGNVQSGISIPYKSWGNSSAFTKFKSEAYENVPSFISATVDNYGGSISLIIDSVQAVDGYTPDQFFPVRYNIDAYWDALIKQIKQRVSDKGYALCDKILFSNKELADRFKVEFAAMNHHDNCKGGLLAHTYKVVTHVANIIANYGTIVVRDGAASQDYTDLLYIGALLHDIGKTEEMNFGVYQPDSIVTHRYLGVEFIQPFKDEIVSTYDLTWYYNLISILLQHHDEFGEPCKTVASYIIHLADDYDATLTLLSQQMESVKNEVGARFKINDKYLTI